MTHTLKHAFGALFYKNLVQLLFDCLRHFETCVNFCNFVFLGNECKLYVALIPFLENIGKRKLIT